jgi:hypothetical protein
VRSDTSRQYPPIVLLALGLGIFFWGAYTGMHVAHLRLEGVEATAVVARIEHRRSGRHSSVWSVLHLAGAECAVRGDVGPVGRTVSVHHARSNASDCAVDAGLALRQPGFYCILGGALLVSSYFAYRRAARSR